MLGAREHVWDFALKAGKALQRRRAAGQGNSAEEVDGRLTPGSD